MDTVERPLEHHPHESGPSNRVRLDLFVVSALALFAELVLIRWIPSVVHVIGFFANVVLIASFLGLGAGMMKARPGSAAAAATRIAVLVGALAAYRMIDPEVGLAANSSYGINEIIFGEGVSVPLPLILVGVFALVAWAVIPFGRLIAASFDQLERIPAYTINIAGSLAGVASFTVVSALGLPSIVWFLVVLLALGLRAGFGQVWLVGVLTVVGIGAVHFVDTDRLDDQVLWSPYNQLRVRSVGEDLADGFVIDVNNQFLLSGLDLSPTGQASLDPATASLRTYYDFPFEIASPDRVLVLGAGAGNDVAAALRAGVDDITAVEIDPRVADFGRDHHPEQPLGDPAVTVVVDDARSFLRSTDESFDLVLFATLDAHGLISSSSSVRLDSFVYTIESLTEAAELLDDDGLLVLSFGPFREEVQLRQYAMVGQVFGQAPRYFVHDNGHRMLVAGEADIPPLLPDGWRPIDESTVASGFEVHPEARRPATDDWPHLYVRQPGIPSEYVIGLLGMTLVGLLVVRRQARRASRSDLPFFFLGAAFLLMETKSVTEFALLIGSTWQTNALVFTVILAIILAANLFVLRGRSGSVNVWLGVVGASLVAQFMWPVSVWPDLGLLSLPAASVYLGVPIFAAAVVFARWFAESRLGSVALGVNLLGAVVGGALEYTSLVVGIRALALVALALYVLAALSKSAAPSTTG